jgi:hypothetical protein
MIGGVAIHHPRLLSETELNAQQRQNTQHQKPR